MRPVRLRCEHREDVPCIDHVRPAARAGRSRAARARPPTGCSWATAPCGTAARSTRRTRSTSPTRAGSWPPASEFAWTVEVWDEAGEPSGPSEPARFRTGPSAWRAEWIGRDRVHDPAMAAPASDDAPDEAAAPAARAARTCGGRSRSRARVRRATLYATARGVLRDGAQRHARRRRRARARLDRLPHADRVRGARRHRAPARRRERARRDPRPRLVRRLRRHRTRCGAATTTARIRRCCASCTSSTTTAASR